MLLLERSAVRSLILQAPGVDTFAASELLARVDALPIRDDDEIADLREAIRQGPRLWRMKSWPISTIERLILRSYMALIAAAMA